MVITLAACATAPDTPGESGARPEISVSATPVRGVPGHDGMQHLAYDLIVTSTDSAPMTLTSVDVLDVDQHLLLRLDGDPLAAATQPLDGLVPTPTDPASGAVAVVVDLTVAPDQIPQRLTHRIVHHRPGAPATSPDDHPITGPELAVDSRSPISISPPLRGTGWLSANTCCDAATTHRSGRVLLAEAGTVAKPETFAVDWIQLHGDQPFAADGANAEQWFGYGAGVHAAVSGTVTTVRDGLPEAAPNALPTGLSPADTAGNHVIVRIGPDAWAFYAHLQPGSIAVAPGDNVIAGQVLGKVGNSGNTLAPHLHFGLLDKPRPDTANSLPFVLGHYTVTGTVDRDSYLAAFSGAGPLRLRPDSSPAPQDGTFPLNLAVNDLS